MPIELRILSGARAGHSARLDKPRIAIGREAASDVRFDPQADLDVSTRHAELREENGRWYVEDQQSRNGTFVNGQRITARHELHEGDVIAFGAQGPTMAVHMPGATPARNHVTQPVETPPVAAPPVPRVTTRRPTAERVAIAVREQTRGMRLVLAGLVIALLLVVIGGWWIGARQAHVRDARIQELVALNEQSAKDFQARLQSMNDTTLINDLRRREDSLLHIVRAAGVAQHEAVSATLRHNHEVQRALVAMDLPAVRQANDDAIVLISTEMGGTQFEATGFSVSRSGLIVTNKHVVTDSASSATRVRVKFANTHDWLPAKVVRLASGPVDLALLRVDRSGTFPTVVGVAAKVDAPVGGTIATIGFPLGTDAPMDGIGPTAMAKTSLTTGTISKSITGLLQIDAFAGHGSSGSPVFDAHSHVIGVVWGGPKGGEGRIVYAVPADRVQQLIAAGK